MTNADTAKQHLAHGKAAIPLREPGRRLSVVALRPGISVFLRPRSYMDTVHEANYRELRMYDVGPHCLFQALDDKGDVKEQAEVLWHSIWWRRVAA